MHKKENFITNALKFDSWGKFKSVYLQIIRELLQCLCGVNFCSEKFFISKQNREHYFKGWQIHYILLGLADTDTKNIQFWFH